MTVDKTKSLCYTSGSGKCTKIVLAGDHMQMEEELLSAKVKEYGLQRSLLERLISSPLYKTDEASQCSTSLIHNYRYGSPAPTPVSPYPTYNSYLPNIYDFLYPLSSLLLPTSPSAPILPSTPFTPYPPYYIYPYTPYISLYPLSSLLLPLPLSSLLLPLPLSSLLLPLPPILPTTPTILPTTSTPILPTSSSTPSTLLCSNLYHLQYSLRYGSLTVL